MGGPGGGPTGRGSRMGGRGQKKVLSANSRYAISKPGAPRVLPLPASSFSSSSSNASSSATAVIAGSTSSVTGSDDIPVGTTGSTVAHSSSSVSQEQQQGESSSEMTTAVISNTSHSTENVNPERIDSQVCIDNDINESKSDEKEKGGWTLCD
jgi:hypothetical protein